MNTKCTCEKSTPLSFHWSLLLNIIKCSNESFISCHVWFYYSQKNSFYYAAFHNTGVPHCCWRQWLDSSQVFEERVKLLCSRSPVDLFKLVHIRESLCAHTQPQKLTTPIGINISCYCLLVVFECLTFWSHPRAYLSMMVCSSLN